MSSQKYDSTMVWEGPNAQVPIFTTKKAKNVGARLSPGSRLSRQSGPRTAARNLPPSRAGVKMTEVLTNSLKLYIIYYILDLRYYILYIIYNILYIIYYILYIIYYILYIINYILYIIY